MERLGGDGGQVFAGGVVGIGLRILQPAQERQGVQGQAAEGDQDVRPQAGAFEHIAPGLVPLLAVGLVPGVVDLQGHHFLPFPLPDGSIGLGPKLPRLFEDARPRQVAVVSAVVYRSPYGWEHGIIRRRVYDEVVARQERGQLLFIGAISPDRDRFLPDFFGSLFSPF